MELELEQIKANVAQATVICQEHAENPSLITSYLKAVVDRVFKKGVPKDWKLSTFTDMPSGKRQKTDQSQCVLCYKKQKAKNSRQR